MAAERAVHELRLPTGTGADAVLRLVRDRYPSATADADGRVVLSRHSWLSAPRRADHLQVVRTVDTLRERGYAPLPGQVDPVGFYRVFPDGVPVREERRVLDLVVGVARRLGGSLVVGAVGGRGRTLRVDPVGRIDLRVLSPVALDPHEVLAAARSVEPGAGLAMDGLEFVPEPVPQDALPQVVRAMSAADRAHVEAVSRLADERALADPDVLDAYALEVPLGPLGTLVVEAHAEDDPPPPVRALGWDDVLAYEVRWLPVDHLQVETDAPGEAFRADRTAAQLRVRALTRAVAELAPGLVLDADGFGVDRWSL